MAPSLPLFLQITGGILVLSSCLAGWGYLGLSALRRRSPPAGSDLSIFDYGLFGVVIVYILGESLSMTVGLPVLAGDLVIITGLGGFAVALSQLRYQSKRLSGHLAAMLFLALCDAVGPSYGNLHYDTGLYHLQTVQWLQGGPLPLGLANIHHRFGFNSSWLVIGGLLDSTRLYSGLIFFTNQALLVLTAGALLTTAWRRLRNHEVSFASLFPLVCLVLLMVNTKAMLQEFWGASPSNDLPAGLVTIYALQCALLLRESRAKQARASHSDSWRILLLFATASLAVTMKLSQAPTLLFGALIAFGPIRRAGIPKSWKTPAMAAGAVAVVVFLLWSISGLSISGCAAFPVSASCIDGLPWSIGSAEADRVSLQNRAWARAPGDDFLKHRTGWGWLPLWSDAMLKYRLFVRVIGVATLCLIALALLFRLLRRRAGMSTQSSAAFWWCMAAGVAGLLLTFLAAPDPRFCFGYLIVTAAAIVTQILIQPWSNSSKRLQSALLWVAVIAVAVISLEGAERIAWKSRKTNNFAPWLRIPVPSYQSVRTESGLTLNVPAGDQCWTLSVPCAPTPPANLRMTEIAGRKAFTH